MRTFLSLMLSAFTASAALVAPFVGTNELALRRDFLVISNAVQNLSSTGGITAAAATNIVNAAVASKSNFVVSAHGTLHVTNALAVGGQIGAGSVVSDIFSQDTGTGTATFGTVSVDSLAVTALNSNSFLWLSPGGIVRTGIVSAGLSFDPANGALSGNQEFLTNAFSGTNWRISFSGDSRTEGAGGTIGVGWPYWLTNQFPIYQQYYATNGGKSGGRMTNLINQYTNDVQRFKTAGGTNSMNIVLLPINDVFDAITTNAWMSNATYYAALHVADGVKLVVATTPPGRSGGSETFASRGLRDFMNEWARTNGLLCIDLEAIIPDMTFTNLSYDGVHFNTNTAAILAREVHRFFSERDYSQKLPALPKSRRTFIQAADEQLFHRSATNNLGMGDYSLYNITSGQYNYAIGDFSIQSITTGYRNITHGFRALQNNTVGSGNIAIGDLAGYDTGFNDQGSIRDTNMLFIGASAGRDGATVDDTYGLTNAGAIGPGAKVGTNSALVIGGGFLKGGIGITNPLAMWHVGGSLLTESFILNSANPVYLKAAPTNSVTVTNLSGLIHLASAAVLVLDWNNGQRYTMTNRVTAATTLVVTNTADGQSGLVKIIGEAAGGTSRVITIQPNLGHLIGNLDDYSVALATSFSFTLTNGNAAEVSFDITRMNGTNINSIVTRQFKF